jgi:hypothetical protein
LDGPAIIRADGSQKWYENDQLHRLDGPAVVWTNGSQKWYVNGKLHRLDGPAYIGADGRQEWWSCGQEITSQVESWMKQQAVVWPWDDQTQTQFVLTWG